MSRTLVIRNANFALNALSTIEYAGIPCESITLDETELEPTSRGAEYQLHATVLPIDCEQPVLWRSSDYNVCEVTSSGLVTVVGVGNCTIFVTCGRKTASCTITVHVELTDLGRYKKAHANAANNGAANDLTRIDSLYQHSYESLLDKMLMVTVDPTQERLAVDFRIVKKNTDTGEYYIPNPLPYATDDTSRDIGYCVPILLPNNCTKVRCVAPSNQYAAYVLFFISTQPCSVESPHYASCAHRFQSETIEDITLDYTASKDFNVPTGADSIVVTWCSASGATNFNEMDETTRGQFKLYAL